MNVRLEAIEYYLPARVLDTAGLASLFPEWPFENIDAKTGIESRHIAEEEEYVSDLAFSAAMKLFETGICSPREIDYILFCTQTPDYLLPNTASLLQHRLDLPQNVGALDFNLGCSGYVYGLGLAEGLVASGQAHNLLLLTADTYTKLLEPSDRSSRALFGDAGTATLLRADESDPPSLGPFIYGTNGFGRQHLWAPNTSITRHRASSKGGYRDAMQSPDHYLKMDGARVLEFVLDTVPRAIQDLLDRSSLTMNQIDLFVLHQANANVLNRIRASLSIPREKFVISMKHCGNTVSSTIPIALRDAMAQGHLRDGMLVMLVGFGVGYSWSGTTIRWKTMR